MADDKVSIINLAKEGQNVDILEAIVRGAEVEIKDEEKKTPLHHAAINGHHDTVVEILHTAGADIEATDIKNMTSLHHAAIHGHVGTVKVLLKFGANIEAKDDENKSPLHHAAINGNVTVVIVLQTADADIEAKDIKSRRPIHYAARHGHANIVELLYKTGADIEANDLRSMTPLHHAALNWQVGTVEVLLKLGANIHAIDCEKKTPLHLAAVIWEADTVNVFYKAGADIEAKEYEWAARNRQINVVKLLHMAGANIEARDIALQSPLFLAARFNLPECLKYLIRHGADVNQPDIYRQTPVLCTASNGNAECLKILIDAGADINRDADTAFQPLQESLVYGNEECAKLLKAAGATINEEELRFMTTDEGIEKKKVGLAQFAEKTMQEKVVKGLKSVDKGLPWEVQSLDTSSAELFVNLIAEDSYELYDTRYMLVGEKDVGKTTLADFLVAKPLNFKRQPTDGISLYNALAFLDRKTKEWLSGDQGFTLDQLLASRLLKVNPLSHNIQRDKVVHPPERKRLQSIEYLSTSVTRNTDVSISDKGGITGITIGNQSEKSASNSNSVGRSTSFPSKDVVLNLAGDSSKEIDMSASNRKRKLITKNIDVNKIGDEEIRKRNKGTTTVNNYCAENERPYENKSCDFQNVIETKDRNISLSMTKETLLAKSWAAGELKIHHNNLVPVLIWDLGGQDTFNATHPTFLTFRAIYMIVFNGSISLDEPVKEFDRLPGMPKNRTSRDYLKFWVKTILTYNKGHDRGFPKLLFVATHKDKVIMDDIEKVRTALYENIDSMFSGRILDHLVTNHRLFVNAVDRDDPEMSKLKAILAEMSFMQPKWGEKMPTCFLPLEMELSSLVARGIKIITYDDLYKLNQNMPIRPLTEEELDLFLLVQHAIGKLLYFNVNNLNEKIILAPTHLIDAFRSIITDRQFCIADGRLQSWNQMAVDGVLKKSTLEQIWQQPEFSHFWCDREYLISLMTHLDILSEPRRYDKNGCLLASDFFLVPSMVRKINETSYFETPDFDKRAICLSFTCLGEILPPALCYRFITYCLSLWPIKKYEEDTMLFEDEAVLVIDNSLDFSIHCGEDRILIRLVHEESNSLIVDDVATALKECFDSTLNNITRLYQQFFTSSGETSETNVQSTFEIKPCCSSAHSPCTVNDMTLLIAANTWQCPGHGIVHSPRSLLAWFVPKGKTECSDKTCASLSAMRDIFPVDTNAVAEVIVVDVGYTNLLSVDCIVSDKNFLSQCPKDLHLRRLSLQLVEKEMHEMFIHLGNSYVEWEHIISSNKDIVNVNFACWLKWRDKSDHCTFEDLKTCLESIKSNPHNLCKVILRDHPRQRFRFILYNVLNEKFIDFTNPDLDRVPSDEDVDKLAPLIGLQSLHFWIELGFTFQNWAEIEYPCRYETDLIKTNRFIINKWKEKCELETGVKPSLRIIYKAFVNIDKSQRIVEKHLQNKK